MGPMDAFFEAMAGFTTTGASTIQTLEEVAPSLLLWRSLTQWAGGIGIVVLFVAVAPLVGFGAAQDRKSTRLNSSHANISYAVFCLKKKTYKIGRAPST